MGLRLTDFIAGGAPVAVGGLLEQHKLNILTNREDILAKTKGLALQKKRAFQTSERLAGETFKTKERIAGEKSKAAEAILERQSREKIASTKATSAGGLKVVPGRGVIDTNTGELIDLPENFDERLKLAGKYVEREMEANKYREEKDHITQEDALSKILQMFRGQEKITKKPKPVLRDKGDKKKIIFTHPTHGDITEDDITETMRIHNLTRQQVIDRLGT